MLVSDEEVIARYPDMVLDHDSKTLFKGFLDRRLLITRCSYCGYYIHFPRRICPKCWSDDVSPVEVSGRGEVYLMCIYHQRPATAGMQTVLHPAVAVELVEQIGLRFTAKLVGCTRESMRIGLPVELDWEDWNGAPIPVFRPKAFAEERTER